MSFGFSDTTSTLGSLPFPLSGFGLGASCNLLQSADFTVLFGVSGGSGTYSFPMPASGGFAGLQLFFQAASIDGAATGGIAVSNGVSGTLGY